MYSENKINKFTHRVNLLWNAVSSKKESLNLEKAKISENMFGLLKEIKAEVAEEDINASRLPKQSNS